MRADLLKGGTMKTFAEDISRRSFYRAVVSGSVLLAAALMLLIARPILARAHEAGAGPDRAERIAARLKDRLNLTANQEAQIKAAIQDSLKKRQEIRKEAEDLRHSTIQKIEASLDPKQLKEFKEIKERHFRRMRRHMRCRRREEMSGWGGRHCGCDD